MAVTTTFSGSANIAIEGLATFSVDRTGAQRATINKALTFAASGGSAPTISGFLYGTLTCSAGDILLAHATDPFQGMGDADYSPGFTVASSKLKLLYFENTDSTNTITIARKTTNGLPIFNAADDALTLAAGDVFLYFKRAGTAALTTGSNDALTISVGAGSPTMIACVLYGP